MPAPNSLRPRRQRGSAYLLTLMVLVALTVIGLSLALVTQTEVQLGSNERVIHETFYSSDAGVAVGTARALALNRCEPFSFLMNDRRRNEAELRYNSTADRVDVSPLQQIQLTPCNLCQINQGSEYFSINHAINARSEKLSWGSAADPPPDALVTARRRVALMIELQPWQPWESACREQGFGNTGDRDPAF